MSEQRLPFIDWMKCLGMLVIIYGHTGGRYITHATDPFNPKQLGVAFFVFVMAFTLAQDPRPAWRVIYNRLFEVYFFGLLFAALMSVVMLFNIGDLNESNYLPFLLGVNVLFDSFPANPTTWYIGTYIHILLFWSLLVRGRRLSLWVVALIALCEIPLRAALIHYVGNYVAYMLFSNWLGVFALGTWAGQCDGNAHSRHSAVWIPAVALVAFTLAWSYLIHMLWLEEDFPFLRVNVGGNASDLVTTSTCVSFLYLSFTWLFFQITLRMRDVRVVRFLARNTLIIFIVHMPLLYALAPVVNYWIEPGVTRAILNIFVYYFILAIISEVIRRAAQPQRLREFIASRLSGVLWNRHFRSMSPGADG